MTKMILKIDGMHCASCAMNIDFDLEELAGIKAVKTSYAKQETVVEYDRGIILEKEVIEQIKKTGYKAFPKVDK